MMILSNKVNSDQNDTLIITPDKLLKQVSIHKQLNKSSSGGSTYVTPQQRWWRLDALTLLSSFSSHGLRH
jgi:hypothetical protein